MYDERHVLTWSGVTYCVTVPNIALDAGKISFATLTTCSGEILRRMALVLRSAREIKG